MEKSFMVYGIGFLLTYIFFKFRKGLLSGMNCKSLKDKVCTINQCIPNINNFFQVVVITGASSGLGESLAHQFYEAGCLVVLCARRRQELDRVRNDLVNLPCSGSSPSPVIVPLDLSDIDSLPGVVNKILSITGKIDILVNNGGISNRGSVLDTKIDVDIKIMTVNYFGSVALTKGRNAIAMLSLNLCKIMHPFGSYGPSLLSSCIAWYDKRKIWKNSFHKFSSRIDSNTRSFILWSF